MAKHPNFFIVGASRSGTTSLWQYLVRHSEIYLPSGDMHQKEPSYFCDLKPRWAREYITLERYLELFAGANGQKAIGEASTPYLVSPESAGRLREAYPRARIIIILRNPIDRALSLYRYLCVLGFEWLGSFEAALDAEETRRHDDQFRVNNPFWYYAYLYSSTGLYAEQVRRYLEAFPREQVHVLLSEDLERDPVATTQQVCSFLGVDASFRPDAVRYNESGQPLSLWLQHRLGRDWERHPMHASNGATLAGRVRRRMFNINVRLGRRWRPAVMRPETRARLVRQYRDDVQATAALIGRPLDHWVASGDDRS